MGCCIRITVRVGRDECPTPILALSTGGDCFRSKGLVNWLTNVKEFLPLHVCGVIRAGRLLESDNTGSRVVLQVAGLILRMPWDWGIDRKSYRLS
jgi:hypothetical protein